MWQLAVDSAENCSYWRCIKKMFSPLLFKRHIVLLIGKVSILFFCSLTASNLYVIGSVSKIVRDFSEAFGIISRSETENTSRFTRVLVIDFHLLNMCCNENNYCLQFVICTVWLNVTFQMKIFGDSKTWCKRNHVTNVSDSEKPLIKRRQNVDTADSFSHV